MNTLEYIKLRQKMWAIRNNIKLVGSQIDKGDEIYTLNINDNLFIQLSESTKSEFSQGDGDELGTKDRPGKMNALHSSSAIGVNVFEYWKQNRRFETLAKSLKIPSLNIESIQFEEKFKIFESTNKNPNVDVVIHYKTGSLLGIECKFTEPFNSRKVNNGLKEKYINDFKYWTNFPNLKNLAEEISPEDKIFKYFHCAQIMKHFMGLYTEKKDINNIRLMYIYLPAMMENNQEYVLEIERLKKVFLLDGIKFSYMTWNELIRNLLKNGKEDDKEYLKYLVERYL